MESAKIIIERVFGKQTRQEDVQRLSLFETFIEKVIDSYPALVIDLENNIRDIFSINDDIKIDINSPISEQIDSIVSSNRTLQKDQQKYLIDCSEKAGFKIDIRPELEQIEQKQLIDYITNTIISKYCVEALKQLTADDEYVRQVDERYLSYLLDPKKLPTQLDFFVPRLAELITDNTNTGDKINLIEFGCGNAEFLVELCKKLRETLPERDIFIIGVEPYSPPENSKITSEFGMFFQQATDNNKTFIEQISGVTSEKNFIIARNAYHHMSCSMGEYLRRCEGASGIMLYEEAINDEARKDLNLRMAGTAHDMICNYAIYKDWANAFMEDSKNFAVLYVNPDDAALYNLDMKYVSNKTAGRNHITVQAGFEDAVAKELRANPSEVPVNFSTARGTSNDLGITKNRGKDVERN